MIKINILWDIGEAGGGGNQFLRTLKRYFVDNGIYCNDPHVADAILVNSKDHLETAVNFKSKTIVHRIDGIFSIYRGKHERATDMKVYNFAKQYAHGIIFQSKWSREKSYENGMEYVGPSTIIYNCADNQYFKRRKERPLNKMLRLFTSSWSSNFKKGFRMYEFLDTHCTSCEYVFAGRSPVNFKNIKMLGVLSSQGIAEQLKNADIFITATEDDTCSNSVIEALTCGVPVVALNSGGTPELIGSGGVLFNGQKDIIKQIMSVSIGLEDYCKGIKVNDVETVGNQYYSFIEGVHNGRQS